MSKSINFRQCTVRRVIDSGGIIETTTYIPDKFAKIGGYLKLKSDDGVWTDNWFVTFVSDKLISEDLLPDPHDEIKAHRRATGDSLPKI